MKQKEVFVPVTALEKCIHAGDLEGTIGCLRSVDAARRSGLAASMRIIARAATEANWDAKLACWWGGAVSSEQQAAAQAAIFFCGTRADRARNWVFNDALYPYLDLLPPAELKSLAADLIEVRPVYFQVVQRLVAQGLSMRPDSDSYIVGLIGVPRFSRNGGSALLACIDADPDLVDGPLLRIFEVEGSTEFNMSAIEKYNHAHDNTWTYALLALVDSGRLSRAQLLDKTLGTLERDWPQFRAGWFSRFYDRLAPVPHEMAPFAQRYLGLCHSRIAPTVTLALAALTGLLKSGDISPTQLCHALAPVMSSAVKGQVDTGLKLLDQVVGLEAGLAPVAAALALRGFAHASAELHKKIIGRLTSWGVPDSLREELAAVLPHVAAVHQCALARLIGAHAPLAAVSFSPPVVPAGLMAPLDQSRRLAPIDDVGELLQTIAYVFENEQDTDQFERAVDALVRMAHTLPAEGERFSPVLKRAVKILDTERDLARALALILGAVFDGGCHGANERLTASGELYRRVHDLSLFLVQGAGLPALSSPTHRRGFIDPAQLLERIASHERANAQSTLDEQARALLRLAPGCVPELLARARSLEQTGLVQAFRYALGDDIVPGAERALFTAAARIRCPGADDPRLADAYGNVGPDGAHAARYAWRVEQRNAHHYLECQVEPGFATADTSFIAIARHARPSQRESYWGRRADVLGYAASVVPSDLEAFFAQGLLEIGNNLDWWEAQWQDKTFLTILLDCSTPVGPIAVKMLAYALGGKEPGQTATAIDAFVAATVEQRALPSHVGAEIALVLTSGGGKGARYQKSLASAARAHQAMPAAVCKVIETLVDSFVAAASKDVAPLLELLLELSLAHGFDLPRAARDNVALLKLSGRGKAVQKEILERFP